MADELKSKVDAGAARFGTNRAAMLVLLGAVRAEEEKIREGGGAKAAEAQRAKGRLTVRERIALLLDPVEEVALRAMPTHGGETAMNGAPGVDRQGEEGGRAFARYPTLSEETGKDGPPGFVADDEKQEQVLRFAKDDKININDRGWPGNFLELGLWAAHGMYGEYGGAPAAGVVTGLGRVSGRLCMIVANDATVKAGAFFPMTAKKVLRAQTIAMENRIPTLYLVDSAGIFLPLQEDVFPDTDDFGRVFRNNAVMSSLGVPQITAIMGMCVAGGAYLPVMTDTVLMTEGSGLFLAGPSLVQAAIGQKTGAEELGGAQMHSEISGTVDFKEKDDAVCIARLRSLVGMMGESKKAPYSVTEFVAERDAPRFAAEDVYGLMDPAPGASNVYDMREVIARIVDRSEFDEYKAEYGRTVLCGYARIGGRAVGIVANQKTNQAQVAQDGSKRTEFGGVIYTESAQKAARFIMDCNQSLVPLIFLHDVNGFMVGKDAEWSGIIRAGAKMVSAVATSVVPKITVIVGGSFGAGHYAMCGKAYDPRFIFAWPTARYAVMSGASAATTLAEVRAKQVERGGTALSEADRKTIFDEIKATYDAQADPRYGAARGWVDAIIDPAKTREILMVALEACALNPEVAKFNVGVLQT
jgi:3-methylcrotonyl-CoA carboxylase beta subunit